MIQPLLSILIPTVVGREDNAKYLMNRVMEQYDYLILGNELVSVCAYIDNKEMTIGEKRELMYKESKGLFSWQIDDDDDISENAIELILEAIRSNPDVDCITFEEHIDIDGKIEKSNHSLTYEDWEGEGGKELWDGFHYHRTPFMKDVIRTDIAISVPIPHIRFGEDHQWAQRLKLVLKTEVHISEQLYKYIHRSSNPTERYGLDRS